MEQSIASMTQDKEILSNQIQEAFDSQEKMNADLSMMINKLQDQLINTNLEKKLLEQRTASLIKERDSRLSQI